MGEYGRGSARNTEAVRRAVELKLKRMCEREALTRHERGMQGRESAVVV